MNLENYTNINIYKRTFEERQVTNSRDMIEHSHNHLGSNKEHAGFNPYQNNEGTVVGKSLALQKHILCLYHLQIFNQVFTFSDCGSWLRDSGHGYKDVCRLQYPLQNSVQDN